MTYTLAHYAKDRIEWEHWVNKTCPNTLYPMLMGSWFKWVAPVKAEEYGMECWLRLGVRALVVDTNACFYRWKKLVEFVDPKDYNWQALTNVMLDSFGYSVMIGCIQTQNNVPDNEDWWSMVWQREHPSRLNDQLIARVWINDEEDDATLLAMKMAYNMFAEVHHL